MLVYCGSSLLSVCGQVQLTTGGDLKALKADKELFQEVTSIVP